MSRRRPLWRSATVVAAAVIAATLLGRPAEARNADWQPAAIADDHSSWLFLDRSGIVRRAKKANVRLLLEYAELQPGVPESNNAPYLMVRSLMSFDCAARTLLSLEEEYLDGDEALLGEADVSAAVWEPVLPESLIEPVYEAVCLKR